MEKSDYVSNYYRMIEEGINGGYAPTCDTTLEDQKLFKSLIYKNFKNHEHH